MIRIVLVDRHRWPGTKTLQRAGKQQWGLGDGQVRPDAGQTRHVYLVSVAYSLQMRSLQRGRPQDWVRRTLTTISAACRTVNPETLPHSVDSIADTLTVAHWSIPEMKAVLTPA